MASVDQVRTRVLIISDTHAATLAGPSAKVAFRMPLPAADVAIHCGDLTMVGRLEEHRKAVELLKSLQAELKIVIPGNHDLTLDSEYCRTHPRLYGWNRNHTEDDIEASKLMYVDDSANEAGIHYLVEGCHSFKLKSGAIFSVYANAFTPEFYDWGFPYPRSEDRFNSQGAEHRVPDFDADLQNDNVAIMVTHGPPKHVLDDTTSGIAAGCDHLRTAVARCKPLLHCFGHIHEGWGAGRKSWVDTPNEWRLEPDELVDVDEEEVTKDMAAYVDATSLKHGRDTLFVNASIMSVRYRPSQAPWLVDLMLQKSTDTK